MPDISGLDIAKAIKSMRGDVIIIAQTGFASDDDRLKCKEAGCDDFISKPIEKNRILKLINKYTLNIFA